MIDSPFFPGPAGFLGELITIRPPHPRTQPTRPRQQVCASRPGNRHPPTKSHVRARNPHTDQGFPGPLAAALQLPIAALQQAAGLTTWRRRIQKRHPEASLDLTPGCLVHPTAGPRPMLLIGVPNRQLTQHKCPRPVTAQWHWRATRRLRNSLSRDNDAPICVSLDLGESQAFETLRVDQLGTVRRDTRIPRIYPLDQGTYGTSLKIQDHDPPLAPTCCRVTAAVRPSGATANPNAPGKATSRTRGEGAI